MCVQSWDSIVTGGGRGGGGLSSAAAPVATRTGREGFYTRSVDTHTQCLSSHLFSMTNSEPIYITGIVVKWPTKTIFQPLMQTELKINSKSLSKQNKKMSKTKLTSANTKQTPTNRPKILTGYLTALHLGHLHTFLQYACCSKGVGGKENVWTVQRLSTHVKNK